MRSCSQNAAGAAAQATRALPRRIACSSAVSSTGTWPKSSKPALDVVSDADPILGGGADDDHD